MKPLLILAALAAAAILLRRINPAKPYKPDADDSEVVGMPTTWTRGFVDVPNTGSTYYVNWDAWFETARRQN